MPLSDIKITKKNVIPILLLGFLGFFLFIRGFFFLAENLSSPSAQISETQVAQSSQTSPEKITPEKLQQAVEEMADFMVKDGNKIGLRIWVNSLGKTAYDFESADSLREKIRQSSNDFSIYRDPGTTLNLLSLLSNYDVIFNEVLLQQLEKSSQ